MPSNHPILCHPLLLPPSIFPSIRVFSNESVFHIRWPKYQRFSVSISPSNEYSGLISFRIGWFDLHAVQGTFKNLLQHHSSKASILHCSAFFIVQLSHPYMTTGKTIALTRWTFVSKVMSLVSRLVQMLSRSVIVFLPRSKRLLISWLWSPTGVILEPKKIKSVTFSFAVPCCCLDSLNVVAGTEGVEAFYSSRMRCQSFREPVLWGCNLYKFLSNFSPLTWVRPGLGSGISFSLCW